MATSSLPRVTLTRVDPHKPPEGPAHFGLNCGNGEWRKLNYTDAMTQATTNRLYQEIKQAIAPNSSGFTIDRLSARDVTHITVRYHDPRGNLHEEKLSDHLAANPDLKDKATQLKTLFEKVWGEPVAPKDYEPGRKGLPRGAHYERAADPVLQTTTHLTTKASTAMAQAESMVPYKGADTDQPLKRMAAVELLVRERLEAVDTEIKNLIPLEEKAKKKALKNPKAHKANAATLSADLERLTELKRQLENVDYFALALALNRPDKADNDLVQLHKYAEKARKAGHSLYTSAHQGVCDKNRKASYVPEYFREKLGLKNDPASQADAYAHWVGGLVFAAIDELPGGRGYAEYCAKHAIPMHAENLEDDLIRAVFLAEDKQTLTSTFTKGLQDPDRQQEFEESTKDSIALVQDRLNADLTGVAAGSSLEKRYKNIRRHFETIT